MEFAQRIDRQLRQAFEIERLEVNDDSAKHAGHSGAHPLGETHFRLVVVSLDFEGVSRVARQRMVYDALKAEMGERVHALQLSCRTPGEDAKLGV
jgi:BolA protein